MTTTVEIPTHLFVYGTLQRGQPNHDLLHVGTECSYVGETNLSSHALVDLVYYPGMVFCGKPSWKVFGELYEIWQPDELLPRVDLLEGYDMDDPVKSHYLRARVRPLGVTSEQMIVHSYYYNRDIKHLPFLIGGTWNAA